MVVDTQTWPTDCAAQLARQYLASPRCGEDDVLSEETAQQLARELIGDPQYSGLPPADAAERFLRACT